LIDRNYRISEAGLCNKYGGWLPKGHFDPGPCGHLSQSQQKEKCLIVTQLQHQSSFTNPDCKPSKAHVHIAHVRKGQM